ncbi:MAG: DUF4179 domain-containing protein [Sarcina sp.]
MRNEFDDLNGIENDLDIEEIVLSEEEKENMRKRVMSKVNKPKKKSNKKKIMAASLCLALGGSFALTNESVMASVEKMGKSLESFFGVETAEVVDYEPYKKEILTEVEDKGIKFILNEAVLDDKELYLSASVDYSKFDLSTLKTPWDGDYSVIFHAQDDESAFSVHLDGEKIQVDGISHSWEYNEELKTVDILFGINMEYAKDLDRVYDIKIDANEMMFQGNKEGGHYEKIEGNWDMEFKVDGAELAKKMEIIEVNKTAEVTRDGKKAMITVEEIRKSPISISMKYKIEGQLDEIYQGKDDSEMYAFELKFYDQNNKKIDFRSHGGSGLTDRFEGSEKWMIDKEVTKIKIVPFIAYYKDGNSNPLKDITFEDEAIEIEVK